VALVAVFAVEAKAGTRPQRSDPPEDGRRSPLNSLPHWRSVDSGTTRDSA